MTLDDLIAELEVLRARCPAAGVAHVAVWGLGDFRYEHGEVLLIEGEDEPLEAHP